MAEHEYEYELRLDADQDQGVRHSWLQSSTGRWRYDPYYCQPFPYWSGQPLPSQTASASGIEPSSPVSPASESATESPSLSCSSSPESNDIDERRTRIKQVRFQ